MSGRHEDDVAMAATPLLSPLIFMLTDRILATMTTTSVEINRCAAILHQSVHPFTALATNSVVAAILALLSLGYRASVIDSIALSGLISRLKTIIRKLTKIVHKRRTWQKMGQIYLVCIQAWYIRQASLIGKGFAYRLYLESVVGEPWYCRA